MRGFWEEGKEHPPSAPLPCSLLWLCVGMSPEVFGCAGGQAPLHPMGLIPSRERRFMPWPWLSRVLWGGIRDLLGEWGQFRGC